MVLKTYRFDKTVFDGAVVLDGQGVVVFPDELLVFDEERTIPTLKSTLTTGSLFALGTAKKQTAIYAFPWCTLLRAFSQKLFRAAAPKATELNP